MQGVVARAPDGFEVPSAQLKDADKRSTDGAYYSFSFLLQIRFTEDDD